jgi:D-alanyl-D-alanine carboxypeptidase (penicillin-binding protein 5/6)
MLLPSANNMADTLAIWAYGTTSNYLVAANKLVKSLGMNQTTISDASGFDPTTVSTSENLILLGIGAINNPIVAQIVSQKTALLPVAGLVTNVDWYVGTNNLIGIKTGNTDQAGGTFLSAAKYPLQNGNTITVIGAVMKAPTLQMALNQTIPMLNSIKDQIQLKTLPAGTKVTSYNAPWSKPVYSITNSTISIPYLPGMPVTYSNKALSISSPINEGTRVGIVEFGVGDDKSNVPQITSSSLSNPSIMWRLTHPGYFI